MQLPSLNRCLQATILGATAALAGCAGKSPIDLNQVTHGSQHAPVTINTSSFPIQTLQSANNSGESMRVYIEGDGRAWITSRTVSVNPTPISSFMPRLAVDDPSPSIYMARPCQYVTGSKCDKAMWTNKRFSTEALSSMSEALDSLKSEYGNQVFELVGYSGGGAMALLLAASRTDVAQVQTIGGNIDTDAWVQLKNLTPMNGSLNPADFAEALSKVPQRHIVGLKDKVVPAEVSESYMLKVQPACGEVVFVNSDHWDAYSDYWPTYRAKAVTCP